MMRAAAQARVRRTSEVKGGAMSRRWRTTAIVLLAMFGLRTHTIHTSAPASSSGDQLPRAECRLTELVRAEPPRDPNADPFGMGPWYVSADRSVWAGWDAGHLVSGPRGNKVLWIRPQGAD